MTLRHRFVAAPDPDRADRVRHLLRDRALLGAAVLPPPAAGRQRLPAGGHRCSNRSRGSISSSTKTSSRSAGSATRPRSSCSSASPIRTTRRSASCSRLQREFPKLDIELVIDDRVYGANYKVSNLHNMYRHAKHDVIVLADSDIRVGPNYLARVVEPLQDRQAGLVTCIYRAINTGGLPTLVESLFVNTDFASLVMLARKVEKSSYAFGATIAMRREVLDEIGGFLPHRQPARRRLRDRLSHLAARLPPRAQPRGGRHRPRGRHVAPPVRPPGALGTHLSRQPPGRLLRQHPDPRHLLGGAERALQRLQPAELRRQRRR